ncbi:Agamous-like MADS-box protein AGL18 [Linum perenne]
MGRKRVKLAFIENQSVRIVSIRKRRGNLNKKAQELSILCGVQVLCIVYSLDEPGVKVLSSVGLEAQQVLARYMTMPEIK